tara:strand:- start:5721 stop:7061 length:1341 start_codon:yes stop_codon:yes gene_type:complete
MVNVQRARTLKSGKFSGNSVLYWMNRDKRVDDNWALIEAQDIAIKNGVPLIVCFQYIGKFLNANIRQYGFLFKGLEELRIKLEQLNIEFLLIQKKAVNAIPEIVNEKSVGMIIVDYNPLKSYRKKIMDVVNRIDIPMYQIDAHNIVPAWVTSQKKEYAAYTIRKKIQNNLGKYLTDFPKIKKHPYGLIKPKVEIYSRIIDHLVIDHTVKEIDWIEPGEKAAANRLKILSQVLDGYDNYRNDPTKQALSCMSPYFHFGHISTQRVALEIKNSSLKNEDKNSFLEEMIVRRELSDNFCEYEPNYDYFEGFHSWAKKTLNEHRDDERDYLYPKEQFEEAKTHDPLWNAAQNQMREQGKMHGYMRMYWAKKILEWSPNPEIAMQIAIELNDKYELDGRDPNGYAGIAWSIGGVHDRAWFERPVYGKIRYMNYNGCKTKFNVNNYINIYAS